MKKKLYLKSNKKKKKNIINIIIILIIIIIIGVIYLLSYINKVIAPALVSYAELEIKKISGIVINRTVSSHITENLKIEDLFIITKNNNDEILTIDYNSIILNKLLTDITSSLQLSLKKLEEGKVDKLLTNDTSNIDEYHQTKYGIVLEIASSQIFNNFLLNNLGPKIPVRLKLLGDIESKITTKVTNYGINNALIEIILNIKVNEKIILPISSNDITLEVDIPVSLKILKGTVPEYYANGINKTSSFLLPIE